MTHPARIGRDQVVGYRAAEILQHLYFEAGLSLVLGDRSTVSR